MYIYIYLISYLFIL